MTVPAGGLRVRRDVHAHTVRVTLTADTEAEAPVTYRLVETALERPFTGTVTPGETAVVEYPVPSSGRFHVEASVPCSVTPAGLVADGGREREPLTRPGDDTRPTTDRPAVGLVATGADADTVIRAVTRAVERGHPVYVGHGGELDAEALRFTTHLGATLVDPDGPAATAGVERALVATARADGCDGIVLANPATSIDFEASQATLALADGFSVAAVPEQAAGGGERLPVPGCVIGLPAYNEASTIATVVRAAKVYADEVVVVDDGSTDGTAAAAEAAGARTVQHPTNQGYGAALRSVFAEAARLDAETLAIIDADGQHDPHDVLPLVAAQRETGADLVIGSRFVEGSVTDIPVYRRIGVGVVNVLTNLAIGRLRRGYITDTQSGFRVYGRRAIRSLAADPTIGDGMNASTDIVFHAARHDYRIVETPITVSYAVENANTLNPVVHGLHLVANILLHLVQSRPVTALTVPGGVLGVLGVLLGVAAFSGGAAATAAPLGVALVAAALAVCGFGGALAGLALQSTADERE